MFDDNKNNKINSFSQSKQISDREFFGDQANAFKKFIVVIIIVIIAILVAFLFFLYEKRNSIFNLIEKKSQNGDVNVNKLPVDVDSDVGNNVKSQFASSGSSEKLTFGSFYKKQNFSYSPVDQSYNLPINIKATTTNYYDISRKINLSQEAVNNLNKNGFAITANTINGNKKDFWSTYQKLVKIDIPIIITNDFLLYYFENNIKSIYKEIEKSVFYDNLWDINMAMYNKSLARYRAMLSVDNFENNSLLESARLELSFFATALKLLEPKKEQISIAKLVDEKKFNSQEAGKYVFELPDFLKNGPIDKELVLINNGVGEHKSPVLLYINDYSRFKVKNSYRNNAKLYNFFLAMEWMRSEFPLYQQSPDCPDCLLDFDDWRINFGAASFIASDLYKDIELKNKWAIVYKYISFFSGLRQDLNFLNYNDAFTKLFGENYNIENIFTLEKIGKDKGFVSIQNELSNYDFSDIEGIYPRISENKKYLGMRLLQDYFWPNDYIFNYLSGTDLKKSRGNKDVLITECFVKNVAYRCNSFGLDIVNLISPVSRDYEYFVKNTFAYTGYEKKYNDIFQQIFKFNTNTWNSNIYWMTLDAMRPIISEKSIVGYAQNPNWQIEKDYNTFLGGWVNIHLSVDEFVNYDEKSETDTLLGNSCNKNNIVEQDIDFINELISRGKMLYNITNTLNISKNTNVVMIRLKKIVNDLQRFRNLEKKEAEGVALSEDDCYFIKTFVKNYSIVDNNDNFFAVSRRSVNYKGSVGESNDGTKLLFVVNQNMEGKKIINVGPIFNYQETRLYK